MKKIVISCFVLLILLPVPALAYGEWPFLAMQSGEVTVTGQGVRIALLDTGISLENLDAAYIEPGYNYVCQGEDTTDLIGHGTAMAGIILGSDALGLQGLAKSATLIPLVCYSIDDKGEEIKADANLMAHAVHDAVDVYDADIINVSTGFKVSNYALEQAIRYAEQQGVLVVAAVGNDNQTHAGDMWYPAGYDTVIGVGAIGENGKASAFSQKNNQVKLSAPGEKIKIVPKEKDGYVVPKNGTSFAAAFISAGAALLLEKNPEITPEKIRCVLFETALDIEQQGLDSASGWGVMQIDRALVFLAADTLQDKSEINGLADISNFDIPDVLDDESENNAPVPKDSGKTKIFWWINLCAVCAGIIFLSKKLRKKV